MTIGGRLQSAPAPISIEDTRVRPPQVLALDNAATFIALDPASDGVSLSLGGDLRGAGPVSLSARLPPGDVRESRVSLALAQIPATMLSAYALNAFDRSVTAGTADIELEVARSGERIDGSLDLTGQALELAMDDAAADAGGESSLEMAAALLEDRDRRISLSLPFASSSGTVFDAATAALRARIAALTETPFMALESGTDINSALASAIPFLPGDAALSDAALLTIDQLTAALNDRPRLGTRILGGYDPDADRNALARRWSWQWTMPLPMQAGNRHSRWLPHCSKIVTGASA